MNRKKIMTVSHDIEAQMFKAILEDAGIPLYISEQNGPHHMEIYLGQEQKGVDLYVEPESYDQAKKIIDEAEIIND
ncbi:MAG: DUF2007 domain-containing protein [Clostridiales bacterium]|nr:DUF2007 domain-containing protein [Clostridiales bacterium]